MPPLEPMDQSERFKHEPMAREIEQSFPMLLTPPPPPHPLKTRPWLQRKLTGPSYNELTVYKK